MPLSLEEARSLAPRTMIFANGGTRRRAVLAGFVHDGQSFVERTRLELIAALRLLFDHGVQHIVTTLFAESHYNEITPGYREHLIRRTEWGITGAEALADYARQEWQVRLIGTESVPELQGAAERLVRNTASNLNGPCVWFTVAAETESAWAHLFNLARTCKIENRRDAVIALYGQEIPPATLFLGNGKPQIITSIVPPLLIGKMQCYWRQHLGFDLDERTFRKILFDYGHNRNTWSADRSGRAEQIQMYQAAWQDPPVVGLGVRLGPFWYPAPTAEVDWDSDSP